MRKRSLVPVAFIAAAFMLIVGFVIGPGSTTAQDMSASPVAEAHPAHIHKGTCDQLGEVVYPLTDVSSAGVMASTPTTATESMEASPAIGEMMQGDVIAQSETTVNAKLDDIISGGHAINVHESAENIQNYIACGDITGSATNGELMIQLNELNSSGYEGQATLKDNGDGTTLVTVKLMHTSGMATPMA